MPDAVTCFTITPVGRLASWSTAASTPATATALATSSPRGSLQLDGCARAEVLDLFESVFHHAAFRSSIGPLVARYSRIRAGLGYMKDAREQGTFPTDPHSHTPAHTGAQQPGMTGQVKEGVLLRWGELGVRVSGGRIRFRPVVLSPSEFLTERRPFHSLGEDGVLEPGTLGFTYCAVPVVYHLLDDGSAWTKVSLSDGQVSAGTEQLDAETSAAVFARRGLVDRIDVGVPASSLQW